MARKLTYTAADWDLIAGKVDAGDDLYNQLKDAAQEADEWEDAITVELDEDEAEAVERTALRLRISECDPW